MSVRAHVRNGIELLRTLRDRHSAVPHSIVAGRTHQALGGGKALRVWREAMQTLGITSPSQFTEIQGLIEERPLAAL